MDTNERPSKVQWGVTPPSPKGKGPEIGFGMEVQAPFHGLAAPGELEPSSIGVAQFPGYETESFPESTDMSPPDMGDPMGEQTAMDMDQQMGLSSLPAIALHAAVLAPPWPPSSSCAHSFLQQKQRDTR